MLSEDQRKYLLMLMSKKTSLQENKISKMMDAETWFSAQKAVRVRFCR